jgi:hypothetical protein
MKQSASKNILFICPWGLDDGITKAYVIPYIRMIMKLSPESEVHLSTEERCDRINREGLRTASAPEYHGISTIPFIYQKYGPLKFVVLLFKLFRLIKIVKKNRVRVVHTFCTPSGVEGYLLKKFTRCKLVVDSFEPHSEYMLEAGVWKKRTFAYRFLKYFELKQVSSADVVIVTTPQVPIFLSKTHRWELQAFFVKPACVDINLFKYDPHFRLAYREEMSIKDHIVGIYVGKIGDFYLSDEIFEYISNAVDFWGQRFHFIFLSPGNLDAIKIGISKFKIPDAQVTIQSAPHAKVAKYLSVADFALSSYKPSPAKVCCTPIKHGEYWSIGLPVVIPAGISIDSDIIAREKIGYVMSSLDSREYRNSFLAISSFLSDDVDFSRERIRGVAQRERGYGLAESVYESIYPSVLE